MLHVHMCLLSAGLVDKLLDSNYHGNWVWAGFEIIPPGLKIIKGHQRLRPLMPLWLLEFTTYAPATVAPVIDTNVKRTPTLSLILILILTLPWTKHPIITLTLTLGCWRYHRRSNRRWSKCLITNYWPQFPFQDHCLHGRLGHFGVPSCLLLCCNATAVPQRNVALPCKRQNFPTCPIVF